jgi:hypothetical protein
MITCAVSIIAVVATGLSLVAYTWLTRPACFGEG